MAQSNDPADLFIKLESNDLKSVQEAKRLIHETLSETAKETWLLNGLVDYYIGTNSNRCLDILSAIQEPHDKHLFDKINDCLKNGSTRMQALSLLGHVVRKQPSWLYKIANHPLMVCLLKLLKNETDAPTLLNALLVLVTLLPVIPALISPHLSSIFEIFCRVAAWNTNKPTNVPDIFILHLQVGVYALFHRLYGMYPCNFLSYLRTYYSNRDHLHTFSETIRPMLERVRMHPLLVTASKEAEISTTRWKKMETHDIIMECAKVSLDVIEGTREEIPIQHSYLNQSFQCSQNTEKGAALSDLSSNSKPAMKKEAKLVGILKLNKGSALSQLLQESSSSWSPSQIFRFSTPPPLQLPSDLSTPESVAIRSPQLFTDSPRLESAQIFKFPIAQYSLSLAKSGSDSGIQTESPSPSTLHSLSSSKLPGSNDPKKIQISSKSKQTFESIDQESSISPSIGGHFQLPKTEDANKSIDYDKYDVDKEVSDIVANITSASQSVLKASEEVSVISNVENMPEEQEKLYRRSDSVIHDDAEGIHTTELEESTETSMGRVMDFVCSRIRYHSQCGPPPDLPEWQNSDNNLTRARSCPEIAESGVTSAVLETLQHTSSSSSSNSVESANIKNNSDDVVEGSVNSTSNAASLSNKQPVFPSEHLLTSALPIIAFSSCHQCSHCQEKNNSYFSLSPPEILDRHYLLGSLIHSKELKTSSVSGKEGNWTLTGSITGDETSILRGQVLLLHNQLLFERHRREVHAERNRRLLAKAKKARALEEQNAAMNDQLRKQEKYISDLKKEHTHLLQQLFQLRQDKEQEWQKFTSDIRKKQQDNEQLRYEKKELLNQLSEQKCENQSLEKHLQECNAELLNSTLELQGIKSKVAENVKLREEVERLNKELILMGELQQKYREKFSSLYFPSDSKLEIENLTASYKNEIQAYKQILDSRNQQLDAFKARVSELESQISQKEKAMNDQKNLIRTIKEEYEEQIQAIKEKNYGLNSQNLNLISHLLYMSNKLQEKPFSNEQKLQAAGIPEEFIQKLLPENEGSGEDNPNLELPLADPKDLSFMEGYIHRLESSESVNKSVAQELDADTSDYIRRRLNFSHLSRRGSSSMIGSASFSTFATGESKPKEIKSVDDDNQDRSDKARKSQ